MAFCGDAMAFSGDSSWVPEWPQKARTLVVLATAARNFTNLPESASSSKNPQGAPKTLVPGQMFGKIRSVCHLCHQALILGRAQRSPESLFCKTVLHLSSGLA